MASGSGFERRTRASSCSWQQCPSYIFHVFKKFTGSLRTRTLLPSFWTAKSSMDTLFLLTNYQTRSHERGTKKAKKLSVSYRGATAVVRRTCDHPSQRASSPPFPQLRSVYTCPSVQGEAPPISSHFSRTNAGKEVASSPALTLLKREKVGGASPRVVATIL
ncbi:hypothetical protein ANAPC5_01325 [Anaplasma phagocytophilum]|nr:hypothetical protein ANAPC5_01325 [Anaplasma phagocytophilum]